MECETADEVISYLEQGSTYRHTGLTRMNDHSSRSHSVFTLVIGLSLSRLILLTNCLQYLSMLSCSFVPSAADGTLSLFSKSKQHYQELFLDALYCWLNFVLAVCVSKPWPPTSAAERCKIAPAWSGFCLVADCM